ncbi:hypothetical protein COJ21_26895 [Priestia megaterium]|uniref:hypothetical protein n=1 Tax=Priestia megaterium TaxID=1404 RepID=UPI000BF43045|nr:hypothetical protein [Priestia megaterium]PFK63099.1 hypothetical protein COJ21_26895 [Priestia megaterium]
MSDQEKKVTHDTQNLTTKSQVTRFVKSVAVTEDIRLKEDSKGALIQQLEQLAIILIRRSEEICITKGRVTIYPEDLEEAYEELLKPHVFIEEVVEKLETQTEELRALAEKSVLRHMEV